MVRRTPARKVTAPERALLLVNGPNLGLLGRRQPEIYGTRTLADVVRAVTEVARAARVDVEALQSNHEGGLVDFLNAQFIAHRENVRETVGIIINPGAYTHTSIALRDALEVFRAEGVRIFEVHISNVFEREPFRHHSYVSGVATGVVCGLGTDGYVVAAHALLRSPAFLTPHS